MKRDNRAQEVKVYGKILLLLMWVFGCSTVWAAEAARVVFTAGTAHIAGRAAQVGAVVGEGERLVTGADGYLYLETSDKGFLILRPASTGQIITYHVDANNPAASRFKIELQQGVARHISGTAVKSARQNFRFNTPVAAVGVRGTDFTVFADQDTTRIAILSGGVIASPLNAECTAGGLGPCEGATSRELFAGMTGQILVVARGQVPELVQGAGHAPDDMAPPRADEPAAIPADTKLAPSSNMPVALPGVNLDPLKISLITEAVLQQDKTPPLIWGRWQALLDQSIEVDVVKQQAGNRLIATNSWFALMRSTDTAWQAPAQSTLGFSLQQSQAAVLDERSRQVSLAQLENGQLNINFANASFFTRFDLVLPNERYQLQNTGEVSADGRLYGGLPFLQHNNMSVRGALNTDSLSAGYLFQARLDNRRIASGATLWGQ